MICVSVTLLFAQEKDRRMEVLQHRKKRRLRKSAEYVSINICLQLSDSAGTFKMAA